MRHVCIVGAGLAGAAAAAALSSLADVTLLDRDGPAAGASGAAAGVVNPYMGLRARAVWRLPDALTALDAMLRETGVWQPAPGLLRPARDGDQAAVFRARAHEFPAALEWYSAPRCAERWPGVQAPHGGLLVRDGRALDVAALVKRLIDRANVDCRYGVAGDVMAVTPLGGVSLRDGTHLTPDVTILCAGRDPNALTAALPLHHIKGQLVRLRAPEVAPRIPILAGDGYAVPQQDSVVVGSTFEHVFSHDGPDPAGVAALRQKAAALVPTLADAEVEQSLAGIRTTVPGTRLPLLGPISASGRLWVFNGLGAKGLLTAPLLASHLGAYLMNPALIPPEVRAPVIL